MVQVEAPTPQEAEVGICVQLLVKISDIPPVVPLIEVVSKEERVLQEEKSIPPV